MFGMGGTEILVILVVALIFLGPDKLPEAAKSISKGIRDLRAQTRELTSTIENDSELGGAIREIKSALRGDEPRRPPRPDPAEARSTAAADPAKLADALGDRGPRPPPRRAVAATPPAAQRGRDAATR